MPEERIVISSEPTLSPDEIASHSFPVAFRGFEQAEVRRFLKRLGDELASIRERERDMRRSLEEARQRLAHPEIDEVTLTAALGEETGRILRSAREAASDVRAKAEAHAARIILEAEEQAQRQRLEAENVLARRVEEADEVAANIRAAAEADSQAVHDRVQAELDVAKARGREMIAEAQVVRERIIGDLARRRRAAQIQIEQLLAGRDRLLETYKSVRGTLDDITAELAHAEDEARVAAEAAHRRVVATPPDDSDLAAMAASGVEEPAPAPGEPTPAPAEPVPPEGAVGDDIAVGGDVAPEPTEEAGTEESTLADGDRLLLERRDASLEPVASDLVRRLKRVLQDEQNEILDRLRQSRGRSRVEDALPSAADQSARYREAALG